MKMRLAAAIAVASLLLIGVGCGSGTTSPSASTRVNGTSAAVDCSVYVGDEETRHSDEAAAFARQAGNGGRQLNLVIGSYCRSSFYGGCVALVTAYEVINMETTKAAIRVENMETGSILDQTSLSGPASVDKQFEDTMRKMQGKAGCH